jgi:hypothetical protein
MVDPAAPGTILALRLFTDRYVVRGRIATTREGLVDTLNKAGDFVWVEDVFFDEYDSREGVGQARFAQVNLGRVVLASLDETAEPAAEAPASTTRDQVLIAVGPYRITGRLDLRNGQDLRRGVEGLESRFVQVSEAVFWSESLNEPRSRVPLVAFNHERAHVIAPFEERDVWAGVDDVTARRVDESGEQLAEPAGSGVWIMDSDIGSLAPGET